MKNPVLKIRKGADFYDDAKPARPVAAEADKDAPPRRRRGRFGRLLFLPLIVVALVVAAFLTLSPSPGTARFPGWDVRLQAATYGDMLLVAFTFSARGTVSAEAAQAELHVVLPDSGASVELSGALASPSTTIRAQLPMTDAVRKVRAEITIGSDRRVLTLGPGGSR
jgi:hypothetical protein